MDPFAIIILGSALAVILIVMALIWRPRGGHARRRAAAGGAGDMAWLAPGWIPSGDPGGHDCGAGHGGDAGGCDGGGGGGGGGGD